MIFKIKQVVLVQFEHFVRRKGIYQLVICIVVETIAFFNYQMSSSYVPMIIQTNELFLFASCIIGIAFINRTLLGFDTFLFIIISNSIIQERVGGVICFDSFTRAQCFGFCIRFWLCDFFARTWIPVISYCSSYN